VLSLNPSQGSLTSRDHALHESQPSLRASQRRLSWGKARSSLAEQDFRRGHKSGSVTGNVLHRRQRTAGEATDVPFVPHREVIAGEKGQYAYRYPIKRSFGNHIAAP
jgi:hypothetical protein